MKNIKKLLIFVLVLGMIYVLADNMSKNVFSSKIEVTYYRDAVKENNSTSSDEDEVYTTNEEDEDDFMSTESDLTSTESDLSSTESDLTSTESNAEEVNDVNSNADKKDTVNFQREDILNLLLIVCGSLLVVVSAVVLVLAKTKKKKEELKNSSVNPVVDEPINKDNNIN